MNIPPQFMKDFEAFPKVLRELLEAELAAGNAITAFGHGFPAPPAGAYIKLAKSLTTRLRASGGGIDFYDRNSSLYSGEITDAKRFYFLLEPPHSPEPEPNMDSIRAALQARQGAGASESLKSQRKSAESRKLPSRKAQTASKPETSKPKRAVERFQHSMIMDYEKWHDGTGYDLKIIDEATPQELVEIENLLVQRPVSDWRDVEALAALNSRRARALLRQTLKSANRELAAAVTDYAPDLASEEEHTATLVAALQHLEIYGGLTQALLQVEEFHPPKVIDALFRGVLARDGGTAVHFAAMLMFLNGKAATSFDWGQRPFFLRFKTDVRAEREAAFRELCERIQIDPNLYLATPKKTTTTRRATKKK